MKYNKKVIIGGTLGAIGVIAAIVTPIVVLKKDDDSSDKDAIKNDLKKFENGESKKIKTELKDAIGLKEKGDEVTFKELGYKKPRLSKGVTDKYTIETPYDENTKEVVVTITLKKNDATATKSITITAISEEKRYLENFATKKIDSEIASTKDEVTFKEAVGKKIKDDSIIHGELGLTKLTLKEGATATYKVKTSYDDTEKSILIIITLEKAKIIVEKEIKVWEKEAYEVRKEEVQGLLNAEQTRVNALTSNDKVEITFDDAIANTATEFTEDIAITLGINLKLNDKFTYTYTSTTNGIKITVKSRAMYSLVAKDATKLIDITYKKVIIDTSKLVGESFIITKTNGLGTIGLIRGVTLPKGVETKYYKGIEAPKSDNDYSKILTNLSNTNIVYIKFFVNSENVNTHVLPTTSDFINPIPIVISGLDQIEIDTTKLIASSFEVLGTSGSGKIKLKSGTTLPTQVVAKFFQGDSRSDDDSDYSETITTLENGHKVFIKFFVKNEYATTHAFPSSFTNTAETTTISDLTKNKIITTKLIASSFKITEINDDELTISIRSDDTLPIEVEVKYFKGDEVPSGDSDYGIAPINLLNGSKVFVKFFVKDKYTTTHILPSEFINPIEIEVIYLSLEANNENNLGVD